MIDGPLLALLHLLNSSSNYSQHATSPSCLASFDDSSGNEDKVLPIMQASGELPTAVHSTATHLPPSHPMVTRARARIRKPNLKYALIHTYDSIPKEPCNIGSDLFHLGWRKALKDELAALSKNETWIIVPRHPSMSVVRS